MRWLEYLFAVDWREPTLYDLMINTEVLSVDAAADLVLSALSESERTTSEISQQALRDRALPFKVRCALAAHPETCRQYWIVAADHGTVWLEAMAPLGRGVDVARSVAGVMDVKPRPSTEIVLPLLRD